MASRSTFLIVTATEAERPPELGFEIVVCGVGKIGAAVATCRRLAHGGVTAVVSFGVAGAYRESGLRVGDVVVATEVGVLDEGLDDGERFEPFVRPGMTVPGAAWRATDRSLATELAGDLADVRVVPGRVATVSVCAGSARLSHERVATGALAEGMEGAAVAAAAAAAGVPFAEVRGISNLCGPRGGAEFELARAIANASRVLERIPRRTP